jgi:predicted O-methyltransferase YrrM
MTETVQMLSKKQRADSADAVAKALTIPGMLRRGEAAYLYRLALGKPVIVELGCYMGRSTSLLLRAAKQSGGQVTTIDSFQTFSKAYEPSNKKTLLKWLAKVGCDAPDVWELSTLQAVSQWPKDKEIDMLFIDAGHSEEDVLRDIKNWSPLVAKGGVLAFHDFCQPNNPGIIRALGQWWTREWRLHGLVDYTISFTRDG